MRGKMWVTLEIRMLQLSSFPYRLEFHLCNKSFGEI